MNALERSPGFFGGSSEHNDLEASHQAGSVSSLGSFQRGVVEELALGVRGLLEELFKFSDESVGFTEIQRTKISKERFINKLVIDVKEEGIGVVLGRLLVGDPVELIFDDLDGLRDEGRRTLHERETEGFESIGIFFLIIKFKMREALSKITKKFKL